MPAPAAAGCSPPPTPAGHRPPGQACPPQAVRYPAGRPPAPGVPKGRAEYRAPGRPTPAKSRSPCARPARPAAVCRPRPAPNAPAPAPAHRKGRFRRSARPGGQIPRRPGQFPAAARHRPGRSGFARRFPVPARAAPAARPVATHCARRSAPANARMEPGNHWSARCAAAAGRGRRRPGFALLPGRAAGFRGCPTPARPAPSRAQSRSAPRTASAASRAGLPPDWFHRYTPALPRFPGPAPAPQSARHPAG